MGRAKKDKKTKKEKVHLKMVETLKLFLKEEKGAKMERKLPLDRCASNASSRAGLGTQPLKLGCISFLVCLGKF